MVLDKCCKNASDAIDALIAIKASGLIQVQLSSPNTSSGLISMPPPRSSLYLFQVSCCVFFLLVCVEAYLQRRYEPQIADIVIVAKEDLDLVSNYQDFTLFFNTPGQFVYR